MGSAQSVTGGCSKLQKCPNSETDRRGRKAVFLYFAWFLFSKIHQDLISMTFVYFVSDNFPGNVFSLSQKSQPVMVPQVERPLLPPPLWFSLSWVSASSSWPFIVDDYILFGFSRGFRCLIHPLFASSTSHKVAIRERVGGFPPQQLVYYLGRCWKSEGIFHKKQNAGMWWFSQMISQYRVRVRVRVTRALTQP